MSFCGTTDFETKSLTKYGISLLHQAVITEGAIGIDGVKSQASYQVTVACTTEYVKPVKPGFVFRH